jgi:hypothetical protein
VRALGGYLQQRVVTSPVTMRLLATVNASTTAAVGTRSTVVSEQSPEAQKLNLPIRIP